jgi:hypothetical protein
MWLLIHKFTGEITIKKTGKKLKGQVHVLIIPGLDTQLINQLNNSWY